MKRNTDLYHKDNEAQYYQNQELYLAFVLKINEIMKKRQFTVASTFFITSNKVFFLFSLLLDLDRDG